MYETETVNHVGSDAASAHGNIQSDISGIVEAGGKGLGQGPAQDRDGALAEDRGEGAERTCLRTIVAGHAVVCPSAVADSPRLAAACRRATGKESRGDAGRGAEGRVSYRVVEDLRGQRSHAGRGVG